MPALSRSPPVSSCELDGAARFPHAARTDFSSNNEWVASSTGEKFDVINPANGKVITQVAHASKEDVDTAVKAARTAFNTTWGTHVHGAARGALLLKLADIMERDTAKIAALESFDSGKGVRIAREADTGDAIACLRYYAGLADKYFGQTINQFGDDKFVYTVHQPIGVCGQIIPWNYPLLMVGGCGVLGRNKLF